jgi:hypothetical protein
MAEYKRPFLYVLDRGQLLLRNEHHIAAAGEFDSSEDPSSVKPDLSASLPRGTLSLTGVLDDFPFRQDKGISGPDNIGFVDWLAEN